MLAGPFASSGNAPEGYVPLVGWEFPIQVQGAHAQSRSSPHKAPTLRWPDVFRRQETSVSKAKQAISDYKKALGDPEGLAELMVFYCERAAGFSKGVSHDDAGYFDALVRMFEQSLKITNTLAGNARRGLLTRLDRVRNISHEFGYDVGEEMDVLLSEFVPAFQHRGAAWK